MTTDTARIERAKREVEGEWRNPQVTAAYGKWEPRGNGVGTRRPRSDCRLGAAGAGSPRAAPSPFAFSRPGTLTQALEAFGFVNVQEETATVPTTFPGSPEQWWEWLLDTAAPVQTWMASVGSGDREQARQEIRAALPRYSDGPRDTIPIEVIVGSGMRAGQL